MTINNAETMTQYLQQHGKLEFSALNSSGKLSDWAEIATNAPDKFTVRKLRTRPGYVIVRLKKA